MDIALTLKNYRCFPDSSPARITIQPGLTALVGTNNSGKSTLLRFLYEFRAFLNVISRPTHGAFLAVARGDVVTVDFPQSVADPTEVFSNGNERDMVIEFEFLRSPADTEPESDITPMKMTLRVSRATRQCRLEAIQSRSAKITPHADHTTPQNAKFLAIAGKNVLDLESLQQAIQPLSATLYIGAFRNAINVGGNDAYFDIQVGQPFLQAWKRLKTGNVKRGAEAAYHLTREIGHIFGFEELEINTSDDGTTLQVLVNGRFFRLEELGSGLSQFILVLANAATNAPAYILIDEPELNLHPTLQLDFLTSLGTYATRGVIFATHSIGLARASAHQIYAFRRIRQGESQVALYEAMPRLTEFLGELSFGGYKELGFAKILLVEGPNDVTTVQQFLRLYGKDHQVLILHLGGAALINAKRDAELAEITRIPGDISALIDSERQSAGAELSSERQAFVASCNKLGIKCKVLDHRAIENYFTDRAVKNVKGDQYRALKPFEHLSQPSPTWAKAENWRIASEMVLEELGETDLGQFLASL